jgi:DNA-binding beta-propeller fold protein YncE
MFCVPALSALLRFAESALLRTVPAFLTPARLLVVVVIVTFSPGLPTTVPSADAQTDMQLPSLQVDPSWPDWPETWIQGASAGIATDKLGNVWILHRPASVTDKRACCKAAPAVMEFDPAGKLLQSWIGPGEGYQWPADNNEHGIYVDYKNNVWIAGRGANGSSENQILKFDNKGKFLLQIGRRSTGNDSNDTANLGQPADMAVYPNTNELFVADGYGNRRVIVFDADTGAYKRHWGAYGSKPDDTAPKTVSYEGQGNPQFNQVHHVRISTDGLVYVADRLNRRIQIFHIDGVFVKEVFVRRDSKETAGTVSSLAFSADPQQQFLYVADQAENQILIFDRQTLRELGSVGRLGRYAGQFISPHNIATDSQGNLYVAEDLGGQRVQKFVFKGLTTRR